MPRSSKQGQKSHVNLGAAILCALALATLNAGSARAQGAGAADPKTDTKAPAKAGEKRPVKENVKQLGREVSDPSTLQRIKAHEQDLEKKVEAKRERQRKDHGAARPSDAVDLAKGLDKPEGGAAPAKTEVKPGAKPRSDVPPAPPPPPAASKPAPAPK
jgi:hypothetical protein